MPDNRRPLARRWTGRRHAVLCLTMLAAGAVAVVACGDGSSTAQTARADLATATVDDRGSGFILRPAPSVKGCTPPVSLPDERAPAAVQRNIRALRRSATSVDGLPVLNRSDGQGSEDSGWLPLRSIDWGGIRRIKSSHPTIHVVPSAMVLRLLGSRTGASSCAAQLKGRSAAGACIVVGGRADLSTSVAGHCVRSARGERWRSSGADDRAPLRASYPAVRARCASPLRPASRLPSEPETV